MIAICCTYCGLNLPHIELAVLIQICQSLVRLLDPIHRYIISDLRVFASVCIADL